MNKSQLRNLYISRRLTQSQIAEKLGCSESKVKYYLNKYDLVKREVSASTDETPKTCSSCNIEKPGTEFYMKSWKGKKALGSLCKICATKKTITRKRSNKAAYVKMKGGCCQACGFDKYDGALEFHHVDPATKEDRIGRMAKGPSSPELLAELAKCVLVCSNCHKMIHAGIIECPPLNQNKDKISSGDIGV
jgi:5-methylcytosine-specific restriction endonuclease McrA